MGSKDQGTDTSRWKVIPRTLCFITNGADVLLMKRAMHKRAFPGRYNGIGGHIERDEDPFTSARREIREETGLAVDDLRLRGICHIDTGNTAEVIGIMLFVFTASTDSRDVLDTDEGSLHWVPITAVHDLPLVEDLLIYLSRLFGSAASLEPFFAQVHYDAADQMIITFNPQ